MALTQFTNLNFEDIKTSIKSYLRQNSKFTDFDFEGSNLSILLNTLAYNSYITAYNTNMVANESFIDSATLRENVVSLARNIGYTPRSKRAAVGVVRFNFAGISSTAASVSIQPGVFANAGFDQKNYLFSLAEKLTVPANNGKATGAALIHQGQYLEKKWTIDLSQPNQTYVLPNNGIDLSTLNVTVQNSASDTTVTNFKAVDSIVGIDGNSNIYLTQETTDEKYEIIFGDGIFGKKLETGNVVTASYIVTDGPTGNGAKYFNFAGTVKDDSGADVNTLEADIRTLRAAEGGDDIESVESIRNYAPRRYAAQNRAVTATDYEALLPSIYTNIESVSAFGGEDLNPPQYGRVFIAAKPRNGNFLPDSTKTSILKSLKSYSIAGIVPSFVDLKFLYVELDSYIYYNTNFVGAPDTLKTNVIDAVSEFGKQADLNKFGGRFKYSKMTSVIDGVDDSITSNITNVIIRRNLKSLIDQFTQYELCFDNEFYHELDSYNIKSTGFSVSGVDGTVYIADKVVPGSDIGNLFLFKLTDAVDVEIVSTNFGTVDYKKGEIIINTVNITSTLLPENIIEIQAVPLSNDVLGRKELYLQLSSDKSNFTMRQDLISSGANVSGTRFDVQSSYSNGNKVRGAIVSSASGTGGLLVGYVNGQAYYGPFHTMSDGTKMTGSVHSVNSVQIRDTLTSITPVNTSSSSTSSSSSSSSTY
tara:strand:+ start:452 stop:2557 length:2106 start_codon:yes stop_codon:yes gene_type:complete